VQFAPNYVGRGLRDKGEFVIDVGER